MPQPDERHVFVYGTLRRGGRNDITLLAPAPSFVGTAQVQGTLYHFDWYPGLALGGNRPVDVVGEVYRITPELEALLDRIEEVSDGEGSEYVKRILPIRVQGRPLECLLYEIHPSRTEGRPPLAHGDWLAFQPSSSS